MNADASNPATPTRPVRPRQSRQWIAVTAVLLVLVSLLLIGAISNLGMNTIAPGSDAPEFEVVDVRTGEPVSFSTYRGKVVLLNIWATWCLPCEEEMPSLQRLHEELGEDGLAIVAVSIDEASREHVLDWITERHLTFDVLQDRSRRMERTYQTTGVPESFIIDRRGRIVKKQIGAWVWDSPTILNYIRRLVQTG